MVINSNKPVTVGYWISTRRNGRRLLLNYLFSYNVQTHSSTCIMGGDKSSYYSNKMLKAIALFGYYNNYILRSMDKVFIDF